MVEQVGAHVGGVLHDVDAVLGELIAITDTRQHQQLWAVDRPAAKHHLASRLDNASSAELVKFHTDGALSVEEHPCHGGLGVQRQIRPAQCRFEVRVGGAPPGALRCVTWVSQNPSGSA